jgi:hypothetical protein
MVAGGLAAAQFPKGGFWGARDPSLGSDSAAIDSK